MQIRRLVVATVTVTFAVSIVATAAHAAPAPKPLKTFGTGDVVATTDSATIDNDAGEYGGVYLGSKSQSSKSLAGVVFEFRNGNGDSNAGSPRLSLPIDTDNKANTNNGYAFLDVYNCGGVSGDNTLVSTQSGACKVNFGGTDYANWAAFVAANPTYKMGQGYIPFIIADDPAGGAFAVDHIVLRT